MAKATVPKMREKGDMVVVSGSALDCGAYNNHGYG
jgi:hypothetical protein